MKNRLFKAAVALTALLGIYFNMEFFIGFPSLYKFMYFTNISNIIVLVVYAVLCAKPDLSENGIFLRFKGAVIMSILVTGIVYNTMLAEQTFSLGYLMSGKKAFGSFLVHVAVPLMVLADWVIFDKKGYYKFYEPFLWAIFPYLYIAFTVIVAQMGQFYPNQAGRYPYEFISWDLLGIRQTAINIVFVTAGFIVLGYVIYFLEKFFQKYEKSIAINKKV